MPGLDHAGHVLVPARSWMHLAATCCSSGSSGQCRGRSRPYPIPPLLRCLRDRAGIVHAWAMPDRLALDRRRRRAWSAAYVSSIPGRARCCVLFRLPVKVRRYGDRGGHFQAVNAMIAGVEDDTAWFAHIGVLVAAPSSSSFSSGPMRRSSTAPPLAAPEPGHLRGCGPPALTGSGLRHDRSSPGAAGTPDRPVSVPTDVVREAAGRNATSRAETVLPSEIGLALEKLR